MMASNITRTTLHKNGENLLNVNCMMMSKQNTVLTKVLNSLESNIQITRTLRAS